MNVLSFLVIRMERESMEWVSVQSMLCWDYGEHRHSFVFIRCFTERTLWISSEEGVLWTLVMIEILRCVSAARIASKTVIKWAIEILSGLLWQIHGIM